MSRNRFISIFHLERLGHASRDTTAARNSVHPDVVPSHFLNRSEWVPMRSKTNRSPSIL